MAQDIRQFYNVAKTRDFSRDFLLRVTNMTVAGLPAIEEEDLVYVKTASLPGRTINNIEVPFMGLNFNIPGSVAYEGSDSYELTFYMDDPGTNTNDLRSKFEIASRNLFDDQTTSGQFNVPGPESTLTLSLLSKNLNDTGKFFRLVGVSLRKIEPVEYKIAEGKGETLELKVTLSYHYYVTNEFQDRGTR